MGMGCCCRPRRVQAHVMASSSALEQRSLQMDVMQWLLQAMVTFITCCCILRSNTHTSHVMLLVEGDTIETEWNL